MSLIVDGPEGAGKSALLLQTADIMARREWKGDRGIVLYEPNAARYTHGYLPYYPLPDSQLFEQPELGSELLKKLVDQNPSAKDASINGQLLGSLYEQTIKNPLDGHRIFLSVLDYLKTAGDFRVYCLFDSVNTLFGATQYRDQTGSLMPVKQLPLLQAILELFTRPTRSITAIGAYTCSDPLIRSRCLEASFKQVCTMHVPDMTRREAGIFLSGLFTLGYLSPTASVDRQFIEHKHFMTGGNSRLLLESAMYDDIYN